MCESQKSLLAKSSSHIYQLLLIMISHEIKNFNKGQQFEILKTEMENGIYNIFNLNFCTYIYIFHKIYYNY